MSPSRLPTTLTGLLVVTCLLHHLHFAATENILLPKRLVAQIGSKVNLQFSDNEIENAFSLGKDMVTRNTRHENDLVRDGTASVTCFKFVSLLTRHSFHRFCDEYEPNNGHQSTSVGDHDTALWKHT